MKRTRGARTGSSTGANPNPGRPSSSPPTPKTTSPAFPKSTARVLERLQRYESRNVTFIAPHGAWPIVWARARGCHVWDAEGRRFLDLSAAFGVAAAGHANPRVVRAGQRQMAILLHAMGDVHPHALKADLARELSRLTFERWKAGHGRTVFCNSGFEAVEVALKTARLATGKPGIIAFEGAYHGLGYGTLNATHRELFRGPFRNQLREFGHFLPFPSCGTCDCPDPARACAALGPLEARLRNVLRRGDLGAILVEPIQARGGIRIPTPDFLALLRRIADEHRVLLIADEIYTGFGRTGRWFACEHSRVVPDLVCLGKALTGGFPLSACVGRASLMDAAWPPSTGEGIHTSTFLGHPVGCAMALAQIREIRNQGLPERAARLEITLAEGLEAAADAARSGGLQAFSRASGLMGGIELRQADGRPASDTSLAVIQRLLQRGYLFLPEGGSGEVISLTPPLIIPRRELLRSISALTAELARC